MPLARSTKDVGFAPVGKREIADRQKFLEAMLGMAKEMKSA